MHVWLSLSMGYASVPNILCYFMHVQKDEIYSLHKQSNRTLTHTFENSCTIRTTMQSVTDTHFITSITSH